MALSTVSPAPLPSPQVVGNAFVEQYYHVLDQSPELVYKFYLEPCFVSRPNSNGVMTSVTTTQAVNDLVLSLDKDCIAEIMTVDSLPSYNGGVLILVTGCLTGQDKLQRKFTQSFFLVPQERGVYFVLNDTFRYVVETQPKELNQMLLNASNDDVPVAPLISDPEVACVQDQLRDPAIPQSEEVLENGDKEVCTSENGDAVGEQELYAVDATIETSNTQPISEVTYSVEKEDAPKKSYASIVKDMKGSTSSVPIYVPTNKAKSARANPEKPTSVSEKPLAAAKQPLAASTKPVPATEALTTGSTSVSKKDNSHDVEGHSVYIRNLPMNATAEQVEQAFKIFGPIKLNGVQVRNHKVEPFCFGFVEFESMESMQDAIKASPIIVAGRKAFVEEKRTTTRVVNGVVTNGNFGGGRGRYLPGRGSGYHGGFGGNVGFGRSDFRNQGEYSGRGRSQGYQQRVFQNGYGRMGRPGVNQAIASA